MAVFYTIKCNTTTRSLP